MSRVMYHSEDRLSGPVELPETLAFTMGPAMTGTPQASNQDVLGMVIEEMLAVVSQGGSPRLVAYARKWSGALSRLRDRGLPA